MAEDYYHFYSYPIIMMMIKMMIKSLPHVRVWVGLTRPSDDDDDDDDDDNDDDDQKHALCWGVRRADQTIWHISLGRSWAP